MNTASGLSGVVNQFGLSLLAELHLGGGGQIFISPLSLATALCMASLGATEGSSSQRELLGLWTLSSQNSGPFFRELHGAMASLTASNDPGVALLTANSIWLHGSIKQSFSQAVRDTFAAEAMPLPESATPINDWCNETTKGMVPSILDSMDPLVRAMLVNVVHFKGQWAPSAKFNKELTEKGTFRTTGRGQKPSAMMSRTDTMRYAEEQDVQMVELPYGDSSRLIATVLLPSSDSALSKLVARLGGPEGAEALAAMMSHLAPEAVALQLPRFRMQFGVHDMKPELMAKLGLNTPFDGTAGFLAMSDDPDVHLSAVLHKAVVEVNEEGTTAAAVTAAVIRTRSLPTPMVVDHPFLFLIRDSATGLLLFAGIVADPDLDL